MSETAWLRGVVESATPGEWRTSRYAHTAGHFGSARRGVGTVAIEGVDRMDDEDRANMAAIVTLHNVQEAAIAVIAAAEELRDYERSGETEPYGGMFRREALSVAIDHYHDVCAKVRACMEAEVGT